MKRMRAFDIWPVGAGRDSFVRGSALRAQTPAPAKLPQMRTGGRAPAKVGKEENPFAPYPRRRCRRA